MRMMVVRLVTGLSESDRSLGLLVTVSAVPSTQ
jgi:hypothetical protein